MLFKEGLIEVFFFCFADVRDTNALLHIQKKLDESEVEKHVTQAPQQLCTISFVVADFPGSSRNILFRGLLNE